MPDPVDSPSVVQRHTLLDDPSGRDSPGERFLPGTVVRRCSRCAGTLTVAESMFFFIEAVGELPVCRACAEALEERLLVPIGADRRGPLPISSEFAAADVPLTPAAMGPSSSLPDPEMLAWSLHVDAQRLDGPRVEPGARPRLMVDSF
jgi:hypothetical protein